MSRSREDNILTYAHQLAHEVSEYTNRPEEEDRIYNRIMDAVDKSSRVVEDTTKPEQTRFDLTSVPDHERWEQRVDGYFRRWHLVDGSYDEEMQWADLYPIVHYGRDFHNVIGSCINWMKGSHSDETIPCDEFIKQAFIDCIHKYTHYK